MTNFVRLTTENREGELELRMVNVADISHVKPARNALPARTCVALMSQPDFPVWATQTTDEVFDALRHLGIEFAPHDTGA